MAASRSSCNGQAFEVTPEVGSGLVFDAQFMVGRGRRVYTYGGGQSIYLLALTTKTGTKSAHGPMICLKLE